MPEAKRPPKDGDFDVQWIDSGREPKCPPDPAYPQGIDVEALTFNSSGLRCRQKLPYPARRCGMYHVKCRTCGLLVVVTTAGRPDDPRSITLDCMVTVH